jgi:hypothetical protein
MRRREFIAGLGATAWPHVARAQQRTLPVIGYLSVETGPELFASSLPAFLQGLSEQGYIEGRNGDRIPLFGLPSASPRSR